MAATSHGLDHPERHHFGALCDAIASAGIDPGMWTANDLKNALNADMRRRGWSWPNEITRPAAFLASRLRLLPARSAANPADASRADGLDQGTSGLGLDARLAASTEASTANAPSAGLSAAVGRSYPPTPVGVSTAPAGACVVCAGGGAVRRPFLPDRRAHVCDSCWDRHAE